MTLSLPLPALQEKQTLHSDRKLNLDRSQKLADAKKKDDEQLESDAEDGGCCP